MAWELGSRCADRLLTRRCESTSHCVEVWASGSMTPASCCRGSSRGAVASKSAHVAPSPRPLGGLHCLRLLHPLESKPCRDSAAPDGILHGPEVPTSAVNGVHIVRPAKGSIHDASLHALPRRHGSGCGQSVNAFLRQVTVGHTSGLRGPRACRQGLSAKPHHKRGSCQPAARAPPG